MQCIAMHWLVYHITGSPLLLGVVGFSHSRNFLLSMFMIVIAGLGMMLHTASSNTILQTIVDEDKRGRVMSIYTMAIMGTAPIGSLLAGSLAKAIGTPFTIMAGGIACIIGAGFFYMKLPELKSKVRTIYVKMGVIAEVATGIQTANEI
jgi:MFS family permease